MDGMEIKIANKRRLSSCDMILRFLGLLLTLVAAIVMGVNKQTKVVPIKLLDSLPPVNFPVSAKWRYQSAFIYQFVLNVIASSYAALSLIILIANKGGKKGLASMIIVADLLMVALLFSSIGAATAIGLLGYEGNSRVQWKKVCNVFDKFCGQAVASVALSLAGSIAFLLLVAFAALRVHKIPS